MTGFGIAGHEDDLNSIQVEVKTLNSKFIDFSFRSPRHYSEKESEVRALVQSVLERGKVNLSLEVTKKSTGQLPVSIDKKLFEEFYGLYQGLSDSVEAPRNDLFKLALQSPNVITNVVQETDETEEDWTQILAVLKEALKNCDTFRRDEGNALEKKLSENIAVIRSGLEQIKLDEGKRKEKIKDKIRGHFTDWLDENQFDANRFEQELIYYFEKLDITEEIVRLETHLDYFMQCITEDSNQGKKLGFISQEIGREINTIGSKANDAEMQKQVILMKDELEKIKEQTMNVL